MSSPHDSLRGTAAEKLARCLSDCVYEWGRIRKDDAHSLSQGKTQIMAPTHRSQGLRQTLNPRQTCSC